jgi:hypothetical protein
MEVSKPQSTSSSVSTAPAGGEHSSPRAVLNKEGVNTLAKKLRAKIEEKESREKSTLLASTNPEAFPTLSSTQAPPVRAVLPKATSKRVPSKNSQGSASSGGKSKKKSPERLVGTTSSSASAARRRWDHSLETTASSASAVEPRKPEAAVEATISSASAAEFLKPEPTVEVTVSSASAVVVGVTDEVQVSSASAGEEVPMEISDIYVLAPQLDVAPPGPPTPYVPEASSLPAIASTDVIDTRVPSPSDLGLDKSGVTTDKDDMMEVDEEVTSVCTGCRNPSCQVKNADLMCAANGCFCSVEYTNASKSEHLCKGHMLQRSLAGQTGWRKTGKYVVESTTNKDDISVIDDVSTIGETREEAVSA